LLSLISCQAHDQDKNDSLNIVCTIFPYYDICSQIVGNNAHVSLLNNSGTDLHNYEPSLKDIKLISNCDIFVYGGGMSDSWVLNTVKASENKDVKLIRLMDHVTTYSEEFKEGMQGGSHDHSHEEKEHDHSEPHVHELDEHIWLSLDNAAEIADVIYETVTTVDENNTSEYLENLNAFKNEAKRIDALYKDLFSKNTKPLVFADRFPFRYFTESYAITYYAAFPGCSTESFASFNTIAHLMKIIQENSIDYILTIDTENSQLASTLAQEMKCKILTLNSCQSVTQKEIDSGITYLKIMENNYQILLEVIS